MNLPVILFGVLVDYFDCVAKIIGWSEFAIGDLTISNYFAICVTVPFFFWEFMIFIKALILKWKNA